MEKIKEKSFFRETVEESIVTLIPALFVIILNLFYSGINYANCVLEYTRAVFLECIIIYCISLLLFGIFKKWKKVITIIGIACLLLGIINQIKFSFTGEPILFSDILYLGSSGEIFDIVKDEFTNTIRLIILPLAIEIITFIILIIIGRHVSNKFEIDNRKGEKTMIGISIFILLILFLPIKPINNIMLSCVFDINKRKDYQGFTAISHYYLYYGVIGGMYGQLLENRIQEPENYDENVINNELFKMEKIENSNKIFGKPNIIVVFSESFWDIGQLEEIEFTPCVTTNFNNLKDKGIFLNMITPSYGGISANVEYEFLTGSNVMYFNRSYVPYMQLYKNNTYYNRHSIISELKNNGYLTKIVTCASPSLFNCGRFYKYIGVDETEFIDKVENQYKKGQYVSDEYVTDKIINEFNNKPKNERLFYMTLTMQAHMPYAKEKYEKYDIQITDSKFSEDVNNTLLSYAQGIYDADKQLGRLYEYIQTLKEPTIIVFYGDHLPYLYYGKDNAIDVIKYFNTEDQILNNYRKYNTQALIVSNFEIEKEKLEEQYLGPDLLGAYILNNMDISISNYYKWLYNTRETISSANYLVTVDSSGKLYNTSELTGIQKQIYDLRKNIEYKLFVK